MSESFEKQQPGQPEEQEQYRKKVSELFATGLESPDIYAYHGTTVEAVTYLSVHGRLPSTGSYGTEFSYVPEGTGSSEGDRQHAEQYAAWNAQKYFVLEQLRFRPSDMENFMYMFDNDDMVDTFMEEASQHGLSKKRLYALMREAERTRKGCLLTLSKRISADFQEQPRHDHKTIITSQGLPIDYITGIEPLGQYEWDELKKIQENLK